MKRILTTALLISLCVSLAGAQAPWQQIPIPELHKFQPQQPKRVQLPNGMVIFLQAIDFRVD